MFYEYTEGMPTQDDEPGLMHLLAPKRTPSPMLGVAVVEALVDAIVTSLLRPGDALPSEGALSDQFGVSRTVIRESLKRVEEKGLIAIERGRGTRVRPTSAWNLIDAVVLKALIKHDDSLGILDELSAVRAQLESAMARETAQRRDSDQLAQLNGALQTMRDAVKGSDAFRAADVTFHEIVMSISGQRLAESIARVLVERARESPRYHGSDPAGHYRLTMAEHEAIYEAIAAQDAERAGQSMNAHILDSWTRRRLPGRAKGAEGPSS
jgi:DNA-binding FadR family transcriptional regulator